MRRLFVCLFAILCLAVLAAYWAAGPAAPIAAGPAVAGRAAAESVAGLAAASNIARPDAPADGDRYQAACTTINPYVVTTVLARVESDADRTRVPAIVALRHSAGSYPDGQVTLATQAEVGDVYGLAYDPGRHQLYAAAYFRAGGRFGPGGPGQIYRIDLATGEIAPLALLEAGPDYHDPAVHAADERPSEALVGKTGLGDLDIAEDGSELAVTNLADGRIYRIALPDGRVLGSFRHGATRERWGIDGRPFGLGMHGGWLYHGLVNTRESSDDFSIYDAQVYRTRIGAGVPPPPEYVLGVNLEYARRIPWGKEWRDTSDGGSDDSPILADIAFRRNGSPILGLRDRQADMAPDCVWDPACQAGPSLGDMLPTRARAAGGWDILRTPPWYRDTGSDDMDLAWGSLAAVPGMDLLVSPGRSRAGRAADFANQVYVDWYDNGSGAPVRSAAAYLPPAGGPDAGADVPVVSGVGGGDIEVLCGPRNEDDMTFPATMTSEAGTAGTATAAAQAIARATALVATRTVHAPTQVARHTAVAQTATAMAPTLEAEIPTETAAAAARAATAAVVAPRLLTAVAPTARALATAAAQVPTHAPATATVVAAVHTTIQQSCGGQNPYLATARFVPQLDGNGATYSDNWLEQQPAVVAFNDTPDDDMSQHFTLAYENQVGAVFGVGHDLTRDQLYVSAYTKRLAQFGPLGPGGIYQIDLASGMVRPWALLPAGRDPHDFTAGFDLRAAASVGRLGLGDIEIAQNLGDVPREPGSPSPAPGNPSGEPGDPPATTLFAVNLSDRLIYRLSVPDGRLLDVIPHGAAGQAWVEDAWPFGLAVHGGWLYHGVVDTRTEESLAKNVPAPRPLAAYVYRSRLDGSAMREVARVDLDYGRQPRWQPWQRLHDEGEARAQAMLVDIEFREDGDLVIGLRDRQADNRVMTAGYGDMVLTMDDASGRFIPLTVPEFYQDNIIHPESSWGTLASMPWLDEVVSTAIDPITIWSGGLLWYDNISGFSVKKETIYSGTNITFAKTTGLGDIESLCFALTPTATPTSTATPPADTPSPTVTRTPSPTPSATRTPSPTITLTPTPSVYRIYLPFADKLTCVPEAIHTDVVLVIDMSTSMYRETRSGRSKHEAALEAAQLFVDLLDLEPDRYGGRDRVGLVGFNDRAWTAIGLTDQRAAVGAAIAGLRDRVEQGTRLDLAIDEGQAVLDRGPRVAHNEPVIILLTDGLPNRVPTPVGGGRQEDTVLRSADRAKRAGTRLFTIGLGQQDDVLDALLRGAASEPRDYFFAPDGEDLAAIYRQIAGRLTECP
jgi:hypothetical protein